MDEISHEHRKGGGVAVFYRSCYKKKPITLPQITTFEYVSNRFTIGLNSVVILAVYRPGSDRPTSSFYEEFSVVLEILLLESCTVIVGGDFNIHVQNLEDADMRKFMDLLDTYSMTQHVIGKTHSAHSTLDLILTFKDNRATVAVKVDLPSIISDHALVTSVHGLPKAQPTQRSQLVHSWKSVSRKKLVQAIKESPLGSVPEGRLG